MASDLRDEGAPFNEHAVTFEQRILEQVQIGMQLAVSKHLLEPQAAIRIEEWASDRVEIGVRGYLWGEQIGKQEVEWPADWWQHFKSRWFPVWALQRWPVLKERRVFVARALYPDYRALFPKQRVVMMMSEEPHYD